MKQREGKARVNIDGRTSYKPISYDREGRFFTTFPCHSSSGMWRPLLSPRVQRDGRVTWYGSIKRPKETIQGNLDMTQILTYKSRRRLPKMEHDVLSEDELKKLEGFVTLLDGSLKFPTPLTSVGLLNILSAGFKGLKTLTEYKSFSDQQLNALGTAPLVIDKHGGIYGTITNVQIVFNENLEDLQLQFVVS